MKKKSFIFLCAFVFLFMFINENKNETIAVIGISSAEADERANALIKEMYKNGVDFTVSRGDGTVYTKRYYCSNVCIDVLSDGSLRYLSDVNDADGFDRFLQWLYSGGDVKIVSEGEFYGFLNRNVRTEGMNCNLCIEKGSGRVVAARILFNY